MQSGLAGRARARAVTLPFCSALQRLHAVSERRAPALCRRDRTRRYAPHLSPISSCRADRRSTRKRDACFLKDAYTTLFPERIWCPSKKKTLNRSAEHRSARGVSADFHAALHKISPPLRSSKCECCECQRGRHDAACPKIILKDEYSFITQFYYKTLPNCNICEPSSQSS